MPRHATELETSPLFLDQKSHDPPVSVGMDYLVVEEGNRLEQMTRVNSPTMVNALMIGTIYTEVYGSKYVRARVDQIKRLAEAKDGLRARELIDIVEAGGKLPAEYYTGESKSSVRPLTGDYQ